MFVWTRSTANQIAKFNYGSLSHGRSEEIHNKIPVFSDPHEVLIANGFQLRLCQRRFQPMRPLDRQAV